MVLLVLTVVLAQPMFVQASSVRLRAKPDTSAAVVLEAPIGTECTQDEAPAKAGWGQYTCSEKTGFTRTELMGPIKPDLATLSSQAKDEKRPMPERYTAASRAVALARLSFRPVKELEPLYLTMSNLFYEVEEQSLLDLRKDPKKRSRPEVVEALMETGQTLERGASWLSTGADWFRIVKFKGDFVFTAILSDNQLLVRAGDLSMKMDPTTVHHSEGGWGYVFKVERSYQVPAEPMLVEALITTVDDPVGCAEALPAAHHKACADAACDECTRKCFLACPVCRKAPSGDCVEDARRCSSTCTDK